MRQEKVIEMSLQKKGVPESTNKTITCHTKQIVSGLRSCNHTFDFIFPPPLLLPTYNLKNLTPIMHLHFFYR